jgi:hypothetical protein
MEGKGESFLPACYEFLTFNFIFVLVAFLLLNWGFKMLFNYRMSKYLRAFSSLVLLAPMLFEGNLQYFFFVLFSQMSLGFSLSRTDKVLNVVNYLVFFAIIWLSVVSCFLAYYLNKKLTKFIIGNWRTQVHGLLAYSLTNVVRMLIIGALHSFLRNSNLQLPLLFAVEASFILFLMISIKSMMIHKLKAKLWFVIIFSVLRMALQILLYLQQQLGIVNAGTAVENLFE